MRACRARPAARCRSSSAASKAALAERTSAIASAAREADSARGSSLGGLAVDRASISFSTPACRSSGGLGGGLGRDRLADEREPGDAQPADEQLGAQRVGPGAAEGGRGRRPARRRPVRRRRRARDPARHRRAVPRHRPAASSPGQRSPGDAGLPVARAHCARRPCRCRARVRRRAVPRPSRPTCPTRASGSRLLPVAPEFRHQRFRRRSGRPGCAHPVAAAALGREQVQVGGVEQRPPADDRRASPSPAVAGGRGGGDADARP